MAFERLLPDEALKPRWSSSSALVYIGGLVVLLALGLFGERLSRLHGDSEA